MVYSSSALGWSLKSNFNSASWDGGPSFSEILIAQLLENKVLNSHIFYEGGERRRIVTYYQLPIC